jgi:hypothetical protein
VMDRSVRSEHFDKSSVNSAGHAAESASTASSLTSMHLEPTQHCVPRRCKACASNRILRAWFCSLLVHNGHAKPRATATVGWAKAGVTTQQATVYGDAGGPRRRRQKILSAAAAAVRRRERCTHPVRSSVCRLVQWLATECIARSPIRSHELKSRTARSPRALHAAVSSDGRGSAVDSHLAASKRIVLKALQRFRRRRRDGTAQGEF